MEVNDFNILLIGVTFYTEPFEAWIYHCHLHPLQAANRCLNSRLVVDEDDLRWFEN